MEAKFREWLRQLDEDVIQGEFGYEDGEFTVYSPLIREREGDRDRGGKGRTSGGPRRAVVCAKLIKRGLICAADYLIESGDLCEFGAIAALMLDHVAPKIDGADDVIFWRRLLTAEVEENVFHLIFKYTLHKRVVFRPRTRFERVHAKIRRHVASDWHAWRPEVAIDIDAMQTIAAEQPRSYLAGSNSGVFNGSRLGFWDGAWPGECREGRPGDVDGSRVGSTGWLSGITLCLRSGSPISAMGNLSQLRE